MADPKPGAAPASPPAGASPSPGGAAPPGALVPARGPTDGPTVDVPMHLLKQQEEQTRMVKPEKRQKRVRARQGAQAKLVVKRPGIPPADLLLTRPRTLVGRDRDRCDVVLEDDSVSRQHASVTREESGYFVLHDLGSRNGIYVGGRKAERRTLVNGDVFMIGDTSFTFLELKPDGTPVEPVKVKPPERPPPPPAPAPASAAPPAGAPAGAAPPGGPPVAGATPGAPGPRTPGST